MRGPIAITLSLSLLAFAGCIGAGGGDTAMGAAASMEAHARDWAADAQLVAVLGFESRGVEEGMGMMPFIAEVEDPEVGDGRLDGWAGLYYSESKRRMAVFVTNATQTFNAMEMDARDMGDEFPAEGLPNATAAQARWSTDSPAAIAALRAANASLDAAFQDTNASAAVFYAVEFIEYEAWHVGGFVGNWSFEGMVAIDSGEVLELEVTNETRHLPGMGRKPERMPLPPPIEESGTTTLSADPMNYLFAPPCTTPTARCVEIPFALEGPARIEATLSWGSPASDYDLYILDASRNILVTSGAFAGTSEQASLDLDQGEYVLQVVPWLVVQDNWTVKAEFGHAGGEDWKATLQRAL
jgi:hypothetical protein